MFKNNVLSAITILVLLLAGCEKDPEFLSIKNINDVALKVTFDDAVSVNTSSLLKSAAVMTQETPANYFVALKSATLMGSNGTKDFELFSEPDLSSSFVFDYTDDNTVHSLLKETTVPDGDYNSIEIEIYYLQMNIAIATGERGVERRNIRIYLSDDAETEGGSHQPGDMTQINDGQEIGWLLGEGQMPNMDPVEPREDAYMQFNEDDSKMWYDFAGKSAADYGPFGDVEFMNSAPHPIYKTKIDFNFVDNNGSELILDFDVKDCWNFEDKSGDGVFGADDLDPVNPTRWHMSLPEMTVTLE